MSTRLLILFQNTLYLKFFLTIIFFLKKSLKFYKDPNISLNNLKIIKVSHFSIKPRYKKESAYTQQSIIIMCQLS